MSAGTFRFHPVAVLAITPSSTAGKRSIQPMNSIGLAVGSMCAGCSTGARPPLIETFGQASGSSSPAQYSDHGDVNLSDPVPGV
jgi:hypothetical protein